MPSASNSRLIRQLPPHLPLGERLGPDHQADAQAVRPKDFDAPHLGLLENLAAQHLVLPGGVGHAL
jgi:hypothetical protein